MTQSALSSPASRSSLRTGQDAGSCAEQWAQNTRDGIITRNQALDLGLSIGAVRWRIQRGRWQPLLPGVYATFSGELSRSCQLWAAVLRAGPQAVLSHRTAAELWNLTTQVSDRVHVTVPAGTQVAAIPGVVLHYSRRLGPARHPALAPPRTRIEETVIDLAQTAASREEALAWILGSCAGRRTTPAHLAAAMARRRRMRWRDDVTAALEEAVTGVHSLLEYRYRHGVERAHGLPAGKRQRQTRRSGRREYSDVAYEEYATLIELDGRAAHPEAARWLDIRRDNAQAADGQVTLRYNWTAVSENSCAVAEEIAQTLRRRGWTGSLRRCGSTCPVKPTPQQFGSVLP